ncbi:MAG: hypothetical protein ACI9GW_002292 [Halieaceae bacterium]|jgi:uncharacterized protein (UPF0276 family)
MPDKQSALAGAGLGLRRALMGPLCCLGEERPDFLEVAPENWISVGGRLRKQFDEFAEQYPITLHGLSLNIGGAEPLDWDLLKAIKSFIRDYDCPFYSDHLTYCADQGHLYDLLPIPFTDEAVHYVAGRIKEVQDILGERIALENASYYAAPEQQMSEQDFITAVLTEADCDLLLDVNNIYVNSINHNYDAGEFLRSLPLERARYIHVAGHYDEADDLKVDTHGANVIDPVWSLLADAYSLCGRLPTLLERDFNLPPVSELMLEIDQIRTLQSAVPDQRTVKYA